MFIFSEVKQRVGELTKRGVSGMHSAFGEGSEVGFGCREQKDGEHTCGGTKRAGRKDKKGSSESSCQERGPLFPSASVSWIFSFFL